MKNQQEERKAIYFRTEAIALKEFQQMDSMKQKEYFDKLVQLEDEVLDFNDQYILRFYTKVFYPNLRKEDNKLFITLDTNERKATF